MLAEKELQEDQVTLSIEPNHPQVEISVGRDEYCRLLVSRQPLLRQDRPAEGTCGLVDLATGTRFVIRRQELYRSDG